MKKKDEQKNLFARQTDDEELTRPEGYPLYPSNDDIYSKYHEEKSIDPDRISLLENSTDDDVFIISDERDFNNDLIDKIIDISESQVGEFQETPDLEDEENTYYSLGGDDHHDLEEDQLT